MERSEETKVEKKRMTAKSSMSLKYEKRMA